MLSLASRPFVRGCMNGVGCPHDTANEENQPLHRARSTRVVKETEREDGYPDLCGSSDRFARISGETKKRFEGITALRVQHHFRDLLKEARGFLIRSNLPRNQSHPIPPNPASGQRRRPKLPLLGPSGIQMSRKTCSEPKFCTSVDAKPRLSAKARCREPLRMTFCSQFNLPVERIHSDRQRIAMCAR
jgi:hypothetical protein